MSNLRASLHTLHTGMLEPWNAPRLRCYLDLWPSFRGHAGHGVASM